MSEVCVKFFASLRDEVGLAETEVAAGSVAELIGALKGMLGPDKTAALEAENVRIAVNQSLISGECRLSPGDEVAFLPPVTGG